MSEFNRDSNYWNQYYQTHKNNPPSLFAQSISPKLQASKILLELGCGNGRDSIFFGKLGIKVTAIDASQTAIDMLKHEYPNINFICGDFVEMPVTILGGGGQFDYCYSRFSIHAIDESQEKNLLINVNRALKSNGKFFIEVRSVHDELFGLGDQVDRNSFIYNGHFRRFIVKEELELNLIESGFKLIYSEENRGFAPFGNSDPPVIRIIASKIGGD